MSRVRHFVAACAVLLAAAVGLACANDGHDRDRYDDRYYRDDPYWGRQRYPVPYGYPDHDYDSRLERHQEREQRELQRDQSYEDKSLKREQKEERKDMKQTDEWSKDDKQRQSEERRELERQQKDDRQDLKRHQKQERKDYWD
jgi:hypothetical protein